MHMKLYNAARADAWLAEVEHGYSLLRSVVNPTMDPESKNAYLEQIDRSRESFLLYAEESTYLEAAAASSNMFTTEESDYSVIFGSAFGGYRLWLQGNLYRAEAFRLYSMLKYICNFENCSNAFVFDPDSFLTSAIENYDIVLIDCRVQNSQ